MTVFVVHPVTGFNLDAAKQFGDLSYINDRYIYGDMLTDNGLLPASILAAIAMAAEDYHPRDDYFLIAGDHLQIVAMSVELARRYPSFRVLRYDRKAEGYFPVTIGI